MASHTGMGYMFLLIMFTFNILLVYLKYLTFKMSMLSWPAVLAPGRLETGRSFVQDQLEPRSKNLSPKTKNVGVAVGEGAHMLSSLLTGCSPRAHMVE